MLDSREQLRDRRRHERQAWYDRVAVERVLQDWLIGQRMTHPGRPLSRWERRIVWQAMRAVGASRNETLVHLRTRTEYAAPLEVEPDADEELAQHRENVASATAYLERNGARDMIEHRRQPLTTAESARIVALEIGAGGSVGSGALFDRAFKFVRTVK